MVTHAPAPLHGAARPRWRVPSLRRAAAAVGLLALAARTAVAQTPPAAPAPDRPRLVVLVTVDQMRADYLDRFAPQLRGGLARLVRDGARFTDAHHDHAITETAPGHATLLAGRFPRATGIESNGAGVYDTAATLLDGAPGDGASPRRFRGTTLVDWLAAAEPRSRALGVSMKDRAAILPLGRSRASAYWYAADGRFTTSRYYADTLPRWVRDFNARHLGQRRAGQAWTPLLPASEYREPDSVAVESAGQEPAFPHPLPADSVAAAGAVRGTPWIDEIVVAFALDGVRALGLGTGPQTDVLNVSLSATDVIGHRFGPDSREIHDQILRLDRVLGVFLDSLARLRPAATTAIVLTADHGVGRIPELAAAGGAASTRVELQPMIEQMARRLAAAGVPPQALIVDPPAFALDRRMVRGVGADPAKLASALAEVARNTFGVLRADRFADLPAAEKRGDPIARRWLHQFPPGAVDLVVTLTPGSVFWGGNVASHGSPHEYDSHVPLIFFGPWFRAGRYDGFVRTVDIAPTLAAVAGVRPLEKLDGVVLDRALRAVGGAAAAPAR